MRLRHKTCGSITDALKKEVSNIIDTVYRFCGQKETVLFADKIMGIGFKYAAKAGMVGFSKALAQEVATRGITVNVVSPGMIETAMTSNLSDDQSARLLLNIPTGRLGKPQEIAASVVYLASEEAAYVTGLTLHVNGGMAML